MNKDFVLFQEEFKKWQRLFGLTGYKIFFKYEPLEGSFADSLVNQTNMVAIIRLNSKLPKEDVSFKSVKRSAKHEAIHVLIARLEKNGCYRYASEVEIAEATEELVVKLEGLIQ